MTLRARIAELRKAAARDFEMGFLVDYTAKRIRIKALKEELARSAWGATFGGLRGRHGPR